MVLNVYGSVGVTVGEVWISECRVEKKKNVEFASKIMSTHIHHSTLFELGIDGCCVVFLADDNFTSSLI